MPHAVSVWSSMVTRHQVGLLLHAGRGGAKPAAETGIGRLMHGRTSLGPAAVLGLRGFSKKNRKAATKERKARPPVQPHESTIAAKPKPGVIEDYAFKAPKTALIRVVACAAAGQVCLALGFAPAFWLKMEFLDVATRGLFIASLLTVSSGLCFAAVKIQRRYVSR